MPRLRREEFQQGIFAWRKPYKPVGLMDLMSVGIDSDVSDRDDRALALAAPSQQRTHTGKQLLEIEGLGEIVVRSTVQPSHSILVTNPCRQHEDRHAASGLAQLPADFQTIDARQVEVENDERILLGQALVQPHLAVKGKIHAVGLRLQLPFDILGEILLVLNDKNVHARFLSCLSLYQHDIRMD